MALKPVVIVGDGDVVLSLDVTDARVAVGWHVANNTDRIVDVDLAFRGNRLVTTEFAPGITTGAIPRNRQWNIDDETVSRTYGLAVRW